MNAPVISVLMPVRNAADTLCQAVDSIFRQHFTAWELIAVNDGSTDDTPEILTTLAAADGRIRVLHQPHRGIVAALQAAAAIARGQFLARMDADDICLPERFTEQLRLFERIPQMALCGTRVRLVGNRAGSGYRRYEAWLNSLISPEDHARECFVECPIAHPTFMIPRTWYETVGGYRESPWPEDYDLLLRVWQAGGKMAKPEAVLFEWYDHPWRLSRTDPRYSPEAFRGIKRHYLPRTSLPVYQWGAGEVGKAWLRDWRKDPGNPAVLPEAVVDINPRKIGRRIHGFPVIAPDDLPPAGNCRILIAVGAPGARDEIRAWLNPRGYRETTDYIFLA